MSFMKKGLRKDTRKQIKRIKVSAQQYLQNFQRYSEIAYMLSTVEDTLDDTNIDSVLEKHNITELDEMGKFLILGEFGRIKDFKTNG